MPACSGERGEDLAVGVDDRVRDGVKVFGHGNGDTQWQRVGALAVAVQDEVAGDGSLGHADGCAVGPAKA